MLLTTLEIARDPAFETAQIELCRLQAAAASSVGTPSLLLPSRIFYDADHPTSTFLISPFEVQAPAEPEPDMPRLDGDTSEHHMSPDGDCNASP